MLNWLKHAFAVDKADIAIPSTTQSESIDLVCREVIRRGMTLPTQMMLESSAPMHFLAGQFLRFVEPFLGTVLDPSAVRDFAAFVERRGAIEYICRRLEVIQGAEKENDKRS
jgi:hypothetical protein